MPRKPPPDLTDPDNPEWTEADFARARPAHEVLPPAVLAQFPNARGRPRAAAPKEPITIRFDAAIARHLRESGKGWQTRVNNAVARLIAAGKL
jgi:uncharacterized protein (DUF4415 family)